MIGNSVIVTNISRCSKVCGNISEGGNFWQTLKKWGISLHISVLDLLQQGTDGISMEMDIFPQRLRTVITNTLSKKENKEHI
jgi:hypothetical protein